MKIFESVSQLIGGTPLLKLNNLSEKFSLNTPIIAKLEAFNPAGSSKDRVALSILNDAEGKGILKPDTVIIEPTSGNTGIGLASICAARGYRLILTMPETMSVERRNLLKAYGAEIILTDGSLGMTGAVKKAEELNKEIENSFIAGQFTNPANSDAHYTTTGPEIWQDTDGKIDIFVAGIGTGGTITGVGRYLKEKNPNIKIIGVEPASSPLLTKGVAGGHKIQGIGANFVPEVLDKSVIDEIIAVADDDALKTGKEMARSEGFLVGISSGAALFAAKQILERDENKGKTVVSLLADSGERYLSTEMFD
ncbi:MAG: cysteine synthase A [Clostridia bacterium]|nr:cysteine synthase A [Clostridia bacterium]